MNKINIELKKAICEWICDNISEFQIYTACTKKFRNYIFDDEGNYLIGGEAIADFCNNAIDLIIEKQSL